MVFLDMNLPKIRVCGWRTHASQFKKYSIGCGRPRSCILVLQTELYWSFTSKASLSYQVGDHGSSRHRSSIRLGLLDDNTLGINQYWTTTIFA